MGNSDLPDLRLGEAARRTGGPARSSRHGGRNYADDSTSGLADARQQRAPKTYGSRLRGQQRLPRSRYMKIGGCRYAPAALRGQPERVPGSAAGTIDPRAARRQRKPSGNPHLRVRFAEGSSKNTPPHTSDPPTRGLASVPRHPGAPPRTPACRGTRIFDIRRDLKTAMPPNAYRRHCVFLPALL